MAHILKRPNGTWQAQVKHGGLRASKVFENKGKAQTWSAQKLIEFKAFRQQKLDMHCTFEDIANRYAREISSKKRGEKWELIRIKAFKNHKVFRDAKLYDINASDISDYRDSRLQEVSTGTVAREMKMLSSMFTTAWKDWGLINKNPTTDVRHPKEPPGRTRIITDDEVAAFLNEIPYDKNIAPKSIAELVGAAFLFSLETGCRAGEIVSLKIKNIHEKSIHLEMTKNGQSRNVPLSKEAQRILSMLPKQGDLAFDLTTGQLDSMFRKIRDKLDADYVFHDARRTFITRTAKKMDVLSLARVVGHTNVNQLMTYYHKSAEDLADLLD